MKYRHILNTILVFILAGVLVAFSSPVSAAGTVVSVATETVVSPGGDFTASIAVSDVAYFDAAQYDITYNPTVIEITGVTDGDIGGTPIPVSQSGYVPSGTQGTIRVINNVTNAPGVTGSGYLAKIHFHVVGAAGTSSTISLQNGLLGDKDAHAIAATWANGSVNVGTSSDTTSGGGGGGGGLAGLTSLLEYITMEGRVTQDVTAVSGDKKVELFILKNTIVKNRLGSLLTNIWIREEEERPAPPLDIKIIGLVYDIYPDGATFDPPITLTFKYDTSELSQGVTEKYLVATRWDAVTDKWIKLESIVDPETATVSIKTWHLSIYALMAPTQPVDSPASFVLSDMSIAPAEVKAGENAVITVKLANTGDLKGSYKVILMVNGISAGTMQVTLDGRASQDVNFTYTPEEAGSYQVEIGSLTGQLGVVEHVTEPAPEPAPATVPVPASFAISDLSITPNQVSPSGEIEISAVVTNTGGIEGSYAVILKINDTEETQKELTLQAGKSERISFTITRDILGSYEVNLNGKAGKFDVVVPQPTLSEPVATLPVEPATNWPLYIGIAAAAGAVIIIGLYLSFIALRRRRSRTTGS